MTEYVEIEEERREVPRVGVGLVVALEFIMMALSVIFFGFDLWPLLLCLAFVLFSRGRGMGASTTALLMQGILAYAFAFYLFAMPLWPAAFAGMAFIVFWVTSFAQTDKENAGDANPIIYILAIVISRAFLAQMYTEVTAVDSLSGNILTWLGIFVLGLVPGVPDILMAIFFILTNGTLTVYLVLLLKRIANPVAN